MKFAIYIFGMINLQMKYITKFWKIRAPLSEVNDHVGNGSRSFYDDQFQNYSDL